MKAAKVQWHVIRRIWARTAQCLVTRTYCCLLLRMCNTDLRAFSASTAYSIHRTCLLPIVPLLGSWRLLEASSWPGHAVAATTSRS